MVNAAPGLYLRHSATSVIRAFAPTYLDIDERHDTVKLDVKDEIGDTSHRPGPDAMSTSKTMTRLKSINFPINPLATGM